MELRRVVGELLHDGGGVRQELLQVVQHQQQPAGPQVRHYSLQGGGLRLLLQPEDRCDRVRHPVNLPHG